MTNNVTTGSSSFENSTRTTADELKREKNICKKFLEFIMNFLNPFLLFFGFMEGRSETIPEVEKSQVVLKDPEKIHQSPYDSSPFRGEGQVNPFDRSSDEGHPPSVPFNREDREKDTPYQSNSEVDISRTQRVLNRIEATTDQVENKARTLVSEASRGINNLNDQYQITRQTLKYVGRAKDAVKDSGNEVLLKTKDVWGAFLLGFNGGNQVK